MSAKKTTNRPEINTCRAGCCRGPQDAVVLDLRCEATNELDARGGSLSHAAYSIAHGQGATEENVDERAAVALTVLNAAAVLAKHAVREAHWSGKAA